MFAIPLGLIAILLCFCRLFNVLKRQHHVRPNNLATSTCSLAVFLGSGGHTSEALQLLSALDLKRYTPRRYIINNGDYLSIQKAEAFERANSSSHMAEQDYLFIIIPRARHVHQSLLSTPFSALWSLTFCIYQLTVGPIFSPRMRENFLTDVLVLNGPGTCASLCIAVLVNRVLGLPSPRVVYVESFARVRSFSVSARLLRSLVDRFVVQWPQLLQDGRAGECVGWLI